MFALFTILVLPLAELVTIAVRTPAGTAIAIMVAVSALAVLRWRSRVAITRGGWLAFEPEDQGTQRLGIGP